MRGDKTKRVKFTLDSYTNFGVWKDDVDALMKGYGVDSYYDVDVEASAEGDDYVDVVASILAPKTEADLEQDRIKAANLEAHEKETYERLKKKFG